MVERFRGTWERRRFDSGERFNGRRRRLKAFGAKTNNATHNGEDDGNGNSDES